MPCPAPPPPLQANTAQWDFALNWMQHVQRAGITYAVVAASDVQTSQRLAALGQACFEWIDEEIPKLGAACGQLAGSAAAACSAVAATRAAAAAAGAEVAGQHRSHGASKLVCCHTTTPQYTDTHTHTYACTPPAHARLPVLLQA